MERRTKKLGAELAQQIIAQYHPRNAGDVKNALNDILDLCLK